MSVRTSELRLSSAFDIVYDHQVFGFQKYGGVSRYFYELAKRVGAAPGFRARVVAPLFVNRYLPAGGVKVAGIGIPVIPKTRRILAIANQGVSRAMLRLSPPDLLHETYYQPRSAAPRGCPVVVTVYDMIHEKFSQSAGITQETSLAKRAAVMRADRVICISANTRSDLIEMFDIDPSKVKMIHLGFTLTQRIDIEALPDLPRPYFLYVGERRGYKNFARLLQAYAASARIRDEFDLIAFGTYAFSADEIASILGYGLDPSQVRHMSGDDALLARIYSGATAFVYPSLYEGFGIPPLEAMSLGCPVLCSNQSSIPEVVGDAGLYFDPRSADGLRAAMENIAESVKLRLDLISRGHRRIGNFSYDRCAAETLEVYRELLL